MIPPTSAPNSVQLVTGLTPLQRRLWFLQQWSPQDSTYHIADARVLRGPLSPDAFSAALHCLAGELEILRTSFPTKEGSPRQCVWEAPRLDFAWQDTRAWPSETRLSRIQRAATRCLETPFDLRTLPLFRVRLWQTGDHVWRCLFVCHHILADPHSLSLFWEGLEALLAGEALPFATEWQLADTVSWWDEWDQSEESERAREFWRERLTPPPPPLESFTDHPRPELFSSRGAQHKRVLPHSLLTQTEAWLRGRKETLFSTFATLTAVLMSRWTRQTSFALATPVDTRTEEAFQEIAGPFVNTLILPFSLDAADSFQAMVEAQHRSFLDALEHRLLPLDELFRLLGLERDPTRPPLAQVMVQLQDQRRERTSSGLDSSPWTLPRETTGWEWAWTLHLHEDNAVLVLERNSSLYAPWVAESLLTTMETLWRLALRHPEEPALTLPLCAEPERAQWERWNATARSFPEQTTLEAIAAQCAKTPHQVALSTEETEWTYAQLWEAVEWTATRLRERGVVKGDRVAVLLERGAWLPLSLLAVWRLGAAYVPLLPEWPRLRKQQLLRQSAPRLCVTAGDMAAECEPFPSWTVPLEALPGTFARSTQGLPPLPTVQQDLSAYVLFTSGSTGTPKGVELGHRALANRLYWMQQEMPLTPKDKVLQKTPVTFDVAGWELFWPLMVGATEVLAPPQSHRSPTQLLKAIESSAITTLHFVPSLLQSFLHNLSTGAASSLRRVVVSGEECTLALQQLCEARLPHAKLTNLYGPTEAAIDVSCWHCVPGEWSWRVPIGHPISNVRLTVVDDQRQPLPPGFPGQLTIHGIALAKGYLDAPSQTAAAFVPTPWDEGERMYLTGDLARARSDGALEFLGRLDQQFKLRGNRLEAGEVEAALTSFPAIREAAVTVQKNPEPRLIAFVVADPFTSQEVHDFLLDRLPKWAIPSGLERIEALPRTSSGKVDRASLPLWRPSSQSSAPLTGETETTLAQLWAALPGMTPPSPEDNFFATGGHSLLAVRLVAEIRRRWQIELSLPAFFRCRSLRSLASLIDQQPRARANEPLQPARLRSLAGAPRADGEWVEGAEPRGLEAPTTPAQRGLWFLQQMMAESALYVIAGGFLLRGELSPAALAESYLALQREYTLLRTSFPAREGVPFQWIHSTPRASLRLRNASGLAEAEGAARDRLRVPLPLTEGPLLEATLWELPSSEWLLQLRVHHILVDGESLTLLWKRWQERYRACLSGTQEALQAPSLHYADYAQWQLTRGPDLPREEAFWKRTLALPLEPQWLPQRRLPKATGERSLRGQRLLFSLSSSTARRLRDLSQQTQGTPYLLLLTALKAWLSGLGGVEDVRVGAPSAARFLPEVQEMPGLFLNTLILRTDCAGNPSFLQLLSRVQATVEAAHQHQQLPLERVLRCLPPEERDGLFRVLFVFQRVERGARPFEELLSEPVSFYTEETHLEWSLSLSDDGHRIQGEWQYQLDSFSEADMEDRLREWLSFLDACLAAPTHPLSNIPLAPPETLRQLLEWSTPPASTQPEQPLAALLTRILLPEEERIALETEEERWTWGEFRGSISAGRSQLQRAGVSQGDWVLLQQPRSCWAIAAMFASWWEGVGVVLLDPEQPTERWRPQLSDNAPSYVWEGIEVCASPAPLRPPSPMRGPACLFLTSGSTGTPKPVSLSRDNLAWFWQRAMDYMNLTPADRVLQFASLGFDTCLEEIGPTLLTGATLCLRPTRMEWLEPRAAFAWCRQREVTVMDLPTAWWNHVVAEAHAEEAGWSPADCPALHTLILGGEEITPERWSSWSTLGCELRVLNTYGPTESSVVATVGECKREEGSAPIGRPLPGSGAAVLLPNGQLAPQGVEGDLWLAGPGLSKAVATEPLQALTPLGFDRWYNTGDRVRWDRQGRLRYCGRRDRQIKLRGARIVLSEIEAALLQLPQVQEAAAWLSSDKTRLEAAVVVPSADVDSTPLRPDVLTSLPPVMRPSVLFPVDALPLTARGKVDWTALQEKSRLRSQMADPHSEPLSPLEETIAACWREVLGVTDVAREDNFFALGGHSLLALRLVAKLKKSLAREVSLRSLWTTSNLGELARSLEGTDDSEKPQLRARERKRKRGQVSALGHVTLKKS